MRLKGVEARILKKYSMGREVESGDKCYLAELASIGFIKLGLSLNRKIETAKATLDGIGALK